jgi:hypothetical protein
MNARVLLGLGWVGLALGCNPPLLGRHSLTVSAKVDGEIPVAGVRVSASGHVLGATDSSGHLVTEIRGREGQEIVLFAECPAGFRSPGGPESLRLSTVRSLSRRSSEFTVSVACRPMKRDVAIVVYSPRLGDVPVLVDGTPRARTDRDGVAQVLVSSVPGDVLSVVLDTSARKDLVSSHITHSLRVADSDQVFVVNEEPALRPASRPVRAHSIERLYRIQ